MQEYLPLAFVFLTEEENWKLQLHLEALKSYFY